MGEKFQLYLDVLQTLERLNAPYVIIGAFAGTSYGVTPTTLDVDIVVDLNETPIQALAAAFLPPRFYAGPFQMRARFGSAFCSTSLIPSPDADQAYIDQWAHRLGKDVDQLWQNLKRLAAPGNQLQSTVTQ